MSGSTNNFTRLPTLGHRLPGEGYDADDHNASEWNMVQPLFLRPHFWAGQNGGGGFEEPWLLTHERVMGGGTWGSSRFGEPPIPPLPVRVAEIERTYIHPMPRPSITESPSSFIPQMRSLQLQTQEEESRLSRDEQNKTLKMLKKDIYNPTQKRIGKRLSLYYRDNASANTRNGTRFDENGGEECEEKCAICLEDFQPKQTVIRTPCNHMFHEECIVPWVKSHGQCPVCRFAICERMRENSVPLNNIAREQVPVDLLIEFLRWGI